MKHISNAEKSKDITKCLWFPQKCTEEDIQNMLMQMAEWKDEQHEKEKQQFVDLACESFCDNCRQQDDCRLTACLNMYGFREKLIKKLQL